MKEQTQVFPASTMKKWIVVAILLPCVTLALTLIFGTGQGYHLNGEIASQSETFNASLKTLFINIPIFGFILGLLVALAPYKKAPYNKKYLRSSLLTILVLQGLMFVVAFAGSIYALIQ